jgi:hypothetical protein
LSSTTTDSCAAALVTGWVSRFWFTAEISLDQGLQFSRVVWVASASRWDNDDVLSSPEQWYGGEHSGPRTVEWTGPEHLPWVLLGLRATPEDDNGVSLVYGHRLALPGEPPHNTRLEKQPASQVPVPL